MAESEENKYMTSDEYMQKVRSVEPVYVDEGFADSLQRKAMRDAWDNDRSRSFMDMYGEYYQKPKGESGKSLRTKALVSGISDALMTVGDIFSASRGGLVPKRDNKVSAQAAEYISNRRAYDDAMQAKYNAQMIAALDEERKAYQQETSEARKTYADLLKQRTEKEMQAAMANADSYNRALGTVYGAGQKAQLQKAKQDFDALQAELDRQNKIAAAIAGKGDSGGGRRSGDVMLPVLHRSGNGVLMNRYDVQSLGGQMWASLKDVEIPDGKGGTTTIADEMAKEQASIGNTAYTKGDMPTMSPSTVSWMYSKVANYAKPDAKWKMDRILKQWMPEIEPVWAGRRGEYTFDDSSRLNYLSDTSDDSELYNAVN